MTWREEFADCVATREQVEREIAEIERDLLARPDMDGRDVIGGLLDGVLCEDDQVSRWLTLASMLEAMRESGAG